MKERPKGAYYLHEIEGEKDIIVVILTADFNGKYARECRENIFKGLHIIFVESGGISDPYFNYAHNCNIGIEKAMEYNTKWVVVSGDDVFKINEVSLLNQELSGLDPKKYDIVFTEVTTYHTRPMNIIHYRFLYDFVSLLNPDTRNWNKLRKKFGLTYGVLSNLETRENTTVSIFKGYLFRSILTNKVRKYKEFYTCGSFGIFSYYFCAKKKKLFDETYINDVEDVDLFFRLLNKSAPTETAIINYKIGDYIGASLGTGYDRRLRVLSGNIYFFSKIENEKINNQ